MNTPLRPAGIDHVVQLVDDMQRATDFYTNVLGCAVDNDLPHMACGSFGRARP